MPATKVWPGAKPDKCQVCDVTFTNGRKFVDGRLKDGRWAIVCSLCHCNYGVGLGVGKGQLYDWETASAVTVKTARAR